MDTKTKKIILIGAGIAVIGTGVTLALQAFNENLVFFFSPSQVAAKEAPVDRMFRLGGVVEPGSVHRLEDGAHCPARLPRPSGRYDLLALPSQPPEKERKRRQGFH